MHVLSDRSFLLPVRVEHLASFVGGSFTRLKGVLKAHLFDRGE